MLCNVSICRGVTKREFVSTMNNANMIVGEVHLLHHDDGRFDSRAVFLAVIMHS